MLVRSNKVRLVVSCVYYIILNRGWSGMNTNVKWRFCQLRAHFSTWTECNLSRSVQDQASISESMTKSYRWFCENMFPDPWKRERERAKHGRRPDYVSVAWHWLEMHISRSPEAASAALLFVSTFSFCEWTVGSRRGKSLHLVFKCLLGQQHPSRIAVVDWPSQWITFCLGAFVSFLVLRKTALSNTTSRNKG